MFLFLDMKTIKRERRQTIVIGPKNFKNASQVFVKSFRYSSSSSSSSSECLPTTENHQIIPESPPIPTFFELLPANDVNLNDNKSKVTLSWETPFIEIDQALELPLIPPREPSHFYRGPSTLIDTDLHLQQQRQQQHSEFSQYYTHKRIDSNKIEFSTQTMHSLVLSPPHSPSLNLAFCIDTELVSKNTTTSSSESIEDFTTFRSSTVTCASDNSMDELERLKRKQQLDAALDSIVSARSLLNHLLTVLP